LPLRVDGEIAVMMMMMMMMMMDDVGCLMSAFCRAVILLSQPSAGE